MLIQIEFILEHFLEGGPNFCPFFFRDKLVKPVASNNFRLRIAQNCAPFFIDQLYLFILINHQDHYIYHIKIFLGHRFFHKFFSLALGCRIRQ